MPLTIVHSSLEETGTGPATTRAPVRGAPRAPLLGATDIHAHLSQRLQTSLDPEHVTTMFARMIADDIAHDGMSYSNEAMGVHLEVGRQSRHSCAYDLIVEDTPIGKIIFRRGRKFTADEIEHLEHLITILAYPLRNAVLYQLAVRSAREDALTGLYNRNSMEQMIAREIAIARRKGQDMAMLVMDIDHFKKINDTWGHSAGDLALKHVADCIRSALRNTDLAFRFGGEEFVIALPDSDHAHAMQAAERLRACIANGACCAGQDREFRMTVSIGVTILRDDDTPPSLFARGDKAMYAAKQTGRNRVETDG